MICSSRESSLVAKSNLEIWGLKKAYQKHFSINNGLQETTYKKSRYMRIRINENMPNILEYIFKSLNGVNWKVRFLY